MKYNIDALIATALYISLAASILLEVTLASATFTSIVSAVFLVDSNFSTNCLSDKMSGPAADSRASSSSSNSLSCILKLFCCLVRLA